MSPGFACTRCGGFLGSARADGSRACTACGASHRSDGTIAGDERAPRSPTPPPREPPRPVEVDGDAQRSPETVRATRPPARDASGLLGVLGVLALGAIAMGSAYLGVAALVGERTDEVVDEGPDPAVTLASDDAAVLAVAEEEARAAAEAAWAPPIFEWTADRESSPQYFYAVGWLTNPNDAAMMSPKVVIQHRDQAGGMLQDDMAFPLHMLLRPHERVPVSLIFDVVPGAKGRTWVTSGARAFASSPAVEGLVVEGLRIEEPQYGLPTAKGRVINRGRQRADRVLVDLLSYDRRDVLVSVDQAYVAADTLAPGEASHFSILLNALAARVVRRDALASASEADPVPP